MSYKLAYGADALRALRSLDPRLASAARARLRELAATPSLGRSVNAPVVGYCYAFALEHEGERWSFLAQYRIAREEELVVESLGWVVVR